MDFITNISIIIGCILSILTLAGIVLKFQKKAINKLFAKYTETLQDQNQREDKEIAELHGQVKELVNTLNTRSIYYDDELKIMSEYCKQGCRNTIKTIYYRYRHEKKIPLYERKTADNAYDLYHNGFHANSYGSLLYNEIIKWEIIPDEVTDHILEE